MANIFRNHAIHRVFLPIVLSTFTLTYAVPLPAQQFNIGFNEIAFMVRLEKLVEKLVNSKDKSIDSIAGYLIDIKQEIETSYNLKLDVGQYVDNVQKEVQKQGVKTNKKQFDRIKSLLKNKDKKAKHHARYLADTMYLEGYQMNAHDEDMMFAQYRAASKHDKHKDKDKDEDKEEVVVPALLVYGVTVALCGMFLMILPIPACKDWGGRMVVAGVTACANSLCSKADENEKNKNKK